MEHCIATADYSQIDITIELRMKLINKGWQEKILGSLHLKGGRVQRARVHESSSPIRLCVMEVKRWCICWFGGGGAMSPPHSGRRAAHRLAATSHHQTRVSEN
jgi:hypothetical protein